MDHELSGAEKDCMQRAQEPSLYLGGHYPPFEPHPLLGRVHISQRDRRVQSSQPSLSYLLLKQVYVLQKVGPATLRSKQVKNQEDVFQRAARVHPLYIGYNRLLLAPLQG